MYVDDDAYEEVEKKRRVLDRHWKKDFVVFEVILIDFPVDVLLVVAV
jgi:hypothetical protein